MPGGCCCVVGCSKKCGHTFPKDKQRRKQWIVAVRRDNWQPSNYSIVCHDHFLPSDYHNHDFVQRGMIRKRTMLKKDAVPCVFHWSNGRTSAQSRKVIADQLSNTSCSKRQQEDLDTAVVEEPSQTPVFPFRKIPSYVRDTDDSDWKPTLRLGHEDGEQTSASRYSRLKKQRLQASAKGLPASLIDAVGEAAENWNSSQGGALPRTRRTQDSKSDLCTIREKNKVRRRKIATFKMHSKSCGAEDDRQAIFCPKHLAMPASSILLHDYCGPIDSSMVVDRIDNQVATAEEATSTLTVTQQSQQQSIRRGTCSRRQSKLLRENAASEAKTAVRPDRQYVRRKGTRSQSKLSGVRATSEGETRVRPRRQRVRRKGSRSCRSHLSSQDSDQAGDGTSINSRQESTEPELMSQVKIEIDFAEDPTDLVSESSPLSPQDCHRSSMFRVQLIKMEPEDEFNCHSTLREEEAAAAKRSHVSYKFKTEVKQEKDENLCSWHTSFSTEQFHDMDIKQENDMDVCGHSEDVSTGWYNADGFDSKKKNESKMKGIGEHKEATEQFHPSDLHTQIKQEKDIDVCSCHQFHNAEQFHVCDCEAERKISEEEGMAFHSSNEAFSTGLRHSSILGVDIKQEKDLDF